MIYDFATELTLSPPTGAGIITWSNGYDLKGGADGDPMLPAGEPLYLQCEVTTAFAADAGSPLAQFGVALGKATPLVSASSIILGMTGGQTDGTVIPGLPPGQLTAGTVFHMPLPNWDDLLESAGAAWPNTLGATELAAFRDFRYLGICCVNVAGTPASNDFTTAGVVKARIVHRMGSTSHLSHTFGSRMGVS